MPGLFCLPLLSPPPQLPLLALKLLSPLSVPINHLTPSRTLSTVCASHIYTVTASPLTVPHQQYSPRKNTHHHHHYQGSHILDTPRPRKRTFLPSPFPLFLSYSPPTPFLAMDSPVGYCPWRVAVRPSSVLHILSHFTTFLLPLNCYFHCYHLHHQHLNLIQSPPLLT